MSLELEKNGNLSIEAIFALTLFTSLGKILSFIFMSS